jgi:uncharacterized protein
MPRFLLLLLVLAAPVACRSGEQQPQAVASPQADLPKLTGRVVDAAGLLPAAAEAELAAQSAALERDVGPQYVIVTVPDLKGEPIEHFGVRLGRSWGIGRKAVNDGLLLIVAPNERKVRIEVGYGLEKRVTDAFAAKVIRERMLPRFKAGDFPAGIHAGTSDLIRRLRSKQDDRQIAHEDGLIV